MKTLFIEKLSSRLVKKRDKWLCVIWEEEKSDLMMKELADIFKMNLSQMNAILRKKYEKGSWKERYKNKLKK